MMRYIPPRITQLSRRSRWSKVGPKGAAGGGDTGAQLLVDAEAYWRMDETGNSVRQDATASNIDLTATATMGHDDGIVNNGTLFPDAVSNLSYVTANHILEPGSDSFTVAGWVWFSGTGGLGTRAFVSHGQGGPGLRGYTLWATWGGAAWQFIWRLSTDGSAFSDLTTGFDFPGFSTWIFFVAGLDTDSDLQFLEFNRGTPITAAYPGVVNSPNVPFMLSTPSDASSQYFSGRLDAIGWWRRLLTTTELDYLYNSGAGNQL